MTMILLTQPPDDSQEIHRLIKRAARQDVTLDATSARALAGLGAIAATRKLDGVCHLIRAGRTTGLELSFQEASQRIEARGGNVAEAIRRLADAHRAEIRKATSETIRYAADRGLTFAPSSIEPSLQATRATRHASLYRPAERHHGHCRNCWRGLLSDSRHTPPVTRRRRRPAGDRRFCRQPSTATGSTFTGWFAIRLKCRVLEIYRSRSAEERKLISLDAAYALADDESGRIVSLGERVPDRSIDVLIIVLLRERLAEKALQLRRIRAERGEEYTSGPLN